MPRSGATGRMGSSPSGGRPQLDTSASTLLPTAEDVAEYYRDRGLAAVIFSVDAETVTGRPAAPNEEIAEVAAAHPDVLIAFASVDPNKGARAVEEAKRLIREHGVRGFKFHPNIQGFFPNDRSVYPLYEVIAAGRAPGALPHRTLRHRSGSARRRGHPAEVLESHIRRRRGRRLPGAADRPRSPVVSLAGRGDLGRAAQGAGVHRPLRLVAEVLPAATRPLREHAPARPRAVRVGLPDADPGSVARRLRGDSTSSPTCDP